MAEEPEVPAGVKVVKGPETPGEETPKTPAQIASEAGGEGKKDPVMVPEAAFLEQKKALKKAEKDLAELKKSIEDGASPKEISDDIDEIAEEYKVDKNFLKKLVKSIESKTSKAVDEGLSSKEKAALKTKEIDDAFRKHFKIAMDKMPEFETIVNPDVIKTLSLQKENANKTFSQIIEETYGKSLTGKRTIDSTKPAGGKDPEPLDYMRAKKDTAYFKEVMANPKLKAEYNEQMLKEGW